MIKPLLFANFDDGQLMKITQNQQRLLRALPSVDRLLARAETDAQLAKAAKPVLIAGIRAALEMQRARILAADTPAQNTSADIEAIWRQAVANIQDALQPNLRRVINATGVVVHTNLGRSLLAEQAADNVMQVAARYSNLEFDLAKGRRGSRYSAVHDLLCELTGAEAAMVVNNNAGAVFLALETLARGREVVVSRGELVEIGGSFRIPDVMARSGAILKEVGTTNRTHPKDYISAIAEHTGLLLKAHTSNFSVIGFTKSVSLAELVEIGRERQVPVMEDLGSGTLIDFSQYGLTAEPTVQASVRAGVDLVTFSGDKLLGGPQAGIMLGRKSLIDAIKSNPLNRALRIDKLTLAALESTLRLYRNPRQAVQAIPTLRMLTEAMAPIAHRAAALIDQLKQLNCDRLQIKQIERASKAGGGALPLLDLPSQCVALAHEDMSAHQLEIFMRMRCPAIIGRIEDDYFLMDMRTVQDDEPQIIVAAVNQMVQEVKA